MIARFGRTLLCTATTSLALFVALGGASSAAAAPSAQGKAHGVALTVAQIEAQVVELDLLLEGTFVPAGGGINERITAVNAELVDIEVLFEAQLEAALQADALPELLARMVTIDAATQKLTEIQTFAEAVSIADMFKMQMLMNHLSQMSEMSSAVVTALEEAVADMERDIKGA